MITPSGRERFAVILVRPDSPENIGLAARGMANTGFSDLRIVGCSAIGPEARRTAVHASAVLDRARFFPTLPEAVADLHLVAGSTARVRRDFPLVTLEEAVERVMGYPAGTKTGLVFGNERTGLTQDEVALSNLRFRIPQSGRQPSYNLGVAVTLTLHRLAFREAPPEALWKDIPLTHAEQEEAGRRFGSLLDSRGFMHDTNRAFITEKVRDIFRRMVLTAKDRDVILAIFRKALSDLPPGGPEPEERNRHARE